MNIFPTVTCSCLVRHVDNLSRRLLATSSIVGVRPAKAITGMTVHVCVYGGGECVLCTCARVCVRTQECSFAQDCACGNECMSVCV